LWGWGVCGVSSRVLVVGVVGFLVWVVFWVVLGWVGWFLFSCSMLGVCWMGWDEDEGVHGGKKVDLTKA
jgi:hypothetical protein